MPAEIPDRFLVAFSFAGEHRDLIRGVAERVQRTLGPGNVFLDEWFEHYLAGPDADLRLQQIYGERCALAVVCVSGQYAAKGWTGAEWEAIRARQIEAQVSPDERDRLGILPIRVGDGDLKGIPFSTLTAVPDVRGQSPDQIAELILGRLHQIIPAADAPGDGPLISGGWPETPPAIRWPMANHAAARDAFAKLLTRASPFRLLLLNGPSESGKSLITRQVLANALRLPGLACGRLDFKGTTDMDAAVRVLVQELGVPLPPENLGLVDRLTAIRDRLTQRAEPALLVFDTYEAAGAEGQDWVEQQLLPSLIRAKWLRVVIAGQRVPDRASAVWGDQATTVILKPPPPLDWFEYGRLNRPELTLADVELFCRLASNKASLLAQLLGPTT